MARAVLWAEWQAGHKLRDIERAHPGPRKVMSQPATQPGFYELINGHDLKKDTAYRWITMSFAPHKAVEMYMAARHVGGGGQGFSPAV